MKVGGLQPAVVEAERLGDLMLKVEFAIVMARQDGARERRGFGGIEPAIEQVARVAGHEAWGPVCRTALKDEAAIAIAAVDEADLVVDLT